MKNLILTTATIDQIIKDSEEFLQEPGVLMAFVYGPEDSYLSSCKFTGLSGKRIFKESIRQQLETMITEYDDEKFVILIDLCAQPYSCSWPDPKSHPQIAELEGKITSARSSSIQKVEITDQFSDAVEMARSGLNCAAVIDNRVPAWDPREQSGDFDPDEF